MTAGPRTDLCNIFDGSTEGRFDSLMATYFFTSTDMQNYPPGTYTFSLTGSAGMKVASATWDMILVDPCPEYDF